MVMAMMAVMMITAVMRIALSVMLPAGMLELGEKIDTTHIENRRQVHVGIPGAMDLCDLVQQPDLPLGVVQSLRCGEVGLVEQDQIGERDLLASLCRFLEPHG